MNYSDGDDQLLFTAGTRQGQRGRHDVPCIKQSHSVSDEAREGGGYLLFLNQDEGRARFHLQVKGTREQSLTHMSIAKAAWGSVIWGCSGGCMSEAVMDV